MMISMRRFTKLRALVALTPSDAAKLASMDSTAREDFLENRRLDGGGSKERPGRLGRERNVVERKCFAELSRRAREVKEWKGDIDKKE